jgi:signal peptidase I
MIKKIAKTIKKIKKNKILSFIFSLIRALIYFILIIILLIILVQKFSNNNFSIGGVRIYNVASGSMRPEYEIGDILITKKVPKEEIEIGDNITYLGNIGDINGLIITHKVQTIREDGENIFYTTKGIANEYYDPEVSYDQVYGKVVYKTVLLSYISKMSTNVTIYIAIMLIGLMVSVQIVQRIFEEQLAGDDEDE